MKFNANENTPQSSFAMRCSWHTFIVQKMCGVSELANTHEEAGLPHTQTKE
jgi:hypothetical protein